MRKQLPFSFLLTTFLFFHPSNFAQEIHFNLVTREPENVGSIVLGMTQDAQGFLWLSTQNGLYRYDGYQYSSYHHEELNINSPAADNIECVAYDRAGYIWLAPRGSGLDRLNPATGDFTHYRHNDDAASLASDTVYAILQDHEGTLWVGTNRGLDKFDKKTNKFLHYSFNANDPSSLSCNAVRIIYEDKRGTIWVGTGNAFFLENSGYAGNGGLNKLDRKTGTFTRYMHEEKDKHSLIDNRVRAIFEDSRGIFWVGTAGDGLHTMDRTKGTFERHLYDPSHSDKLSRPPVVNKIFYAVDHITFITEDNKGRIWIGTYEGGINVYEPSTRKVSYYGAGKKSKEKLNDEQFWTAFKTIDNVIWTSTWNNNLYKIIPYQTSLPYTRIGKVVHSFAEDDAHTLWLGTLHGLIHKAGGIEERILVNNDSSAPSNEIYYIEKERDKFWLATLGGLYLFDPVAKKTLYAYHHRVNDASSLLSDTLLVVKKGQDNQLWIGTHYGLTLLNKKTGACTHFKNNTADSESISDNRVYTINVDKDKNVWAGTYKGLNKLDKQLQHFKRYLGSLTIFSIKEDREGNIWCGTRSGLFKYDKKADIFLSFTDKSAILTTSLMVSWIIEDREQNLWLNTAKGLIRLNKERNSALLYGKNQGVKSLGMKQNGYTLQNGEILYGDAYGYYGFSPGLLRRNSWSTLVTISKLVIKNTEPSPAVKGNLFEPILQKKKIILNHDQNTFSFEFSSVDFISEHEDVHLLYVLQNYDEGWRKAGDEKTAYYYNVPSGNYIFKVKAVNAVGVAAEKQISIDIEPPWWTTWWAYAVFAGLFAILIWLLVVYLSIKLKQENKALEQKIKMRTQLIEAAVRSEENERTRIGETLHDEVGAFLSASKLHIQGIKTNTLDERDKQLHEKGRVLLDEVIQRVRGISHNLHSSILREFGLNEAIRYFINNTVKGTILQAATNLDNHYVTRDAEKDISIYRTVQELVNNIIKYANASRIDINSNLTGNNLEITLFHDGDGLSQKKFEELRYKKDGLGLKNVQNRIILLKGKIEFAVDENEYRISINVPVNEQVI